MQTIRHDLHQTNKDTYVTIMRYNKEMVLPCTKLGLLTLRPCTIG